MAFAQKVELLAAGKDAVALAQQISSRADVLSASSEEEAQYKLLVLYHVARAKQTMEAILLLCEADLTDQAMTLSRTIFEQAITVAYVSKDGPARAHLYAEYDSIIQHQWLEAVEKWSSKWPELSAAVSQERKDEIKAEYQRLKQNYKKPYQWSGKSMKRMAQEVGEEMSYELIYKLLCEKSHNAVMCAKDYLQQVANSILVNFSSEGKYLGPAIAGSLENFLYLLKSYAETWELGFEHELQTLVDRVAGLHPMGG